MLCYQAVKTFLANRLDRQAGLNQFGILFQEAVCFQY